MDRNEFSLNVWIENSHNIIPFLKSVGNNNTCNLSFLCVYWSYMSDILVQMKIKTNFHKL